MKKIEQIENTEASESQPTQTPLYPESYWMDLVNDSFRWNQRKEASRLRLERSRRAMHLTLKRANKIIEMIDYFRSINFNKPALKKSAASIQDSVSQVLRAMSYEYPFQKITILKILSHDLPLALISRKDLDAILFQLIFKARRRIGNEPGIIRIEAFSEAADQSSKSECRLVIRISDQCGNKTCRKKYSRNNLAGSDGHKSNMGFYMMERLVKSNSGTVTLDPEAKDNEVVLEFRSAERTGASCS